jgi:hypothetical protein
LWSSRCAPTAPEAAPGHVQEVRRLVFDPLTKTQSRQLREIGRRITRAIDPTTTAPTCGVSKLGYQR